MEFHAPELADAPFKSGRNAYETRIGWLEEENERLLQIIEMMRKAVADQYNVFPIEWRLSRTQSAFLSLLMAHSIATRAALMAAMYDVNGHYDAECRTLDVHISKLRGKLKFLEVDVRCKRDIGYSIPPEHKQRLHQAMEG